MGSWQDHDEVDQQRLDLLIDGELSEEQERQLIGQLERSPDGWRRCALTFLEHRSWQRAIQAVAAPCQDVGHARARRAATADGRSRPWTWALAASALAALFLAAFGVGTLVRPAGNSPEVAGQPTSPAPPPPAALAHAPSPTEPPQAAGAGPVEHLYLGDLTLVNDAGGKIDVPVYDWNQHVAEELMFRAQPLPPEVIRQLKRHQVRSSRSYTHVQLQDGRQIVFPVQEVDITPVSRTAY